MNGDRSAPPGTRDVDEVCVEHGLLAHVFVHEAAHAVAAVRHGIRFTEVRVRPPGAWVAHSGGRRAGGVVMGPDDPLGWVRTDPAGAFVFVMAGSAAEFVVLGHYMPRSWLGDLTLWCRGGGVPEPSVMADFRGTVGAFLAEPVADAIARTVKWVEADRAAVDAVVTGLAGTDVRGLVGGAVPVATRDWSLSEEEVVRLVARAGGGGGGVTRTRARTGAGRARPTGLEQHAAALVL